MAKPGISKYVKLNDSKWLEKQYLGNFRSLNHIARESGCTASSVRSALLRFGIKLRSKSEGQRLRYGKEDFFQINKDVIDGCLLGDACLRKMNKYSNDSLPLFLKKNLYHDHILLVASLLFGQNHTDRIREVRSYHGYGLAGNAKSMFSLSSLTHPELEPFYQRWYPRTNDFHKVVPEDIAISPTMLLHWFMDDGYSYWVSYKNDKQRYLRVEFATQSFNKPELDFLAESILNILGLRMAVRLHKRHGEIRGTGYEMHVQQKDVPKFFEVIGPCPVPSLAYKWKIPS